MSNKSKLIYSLIFSIVLSSLSFPSCSPQRGGRNVGQIGVGKGGKKHRSTASSKVKRRSKY